MNRPAEPSDVSAYRHMDSPLPVNALALATAISSMLLLILMRGVNDNIATLFEAENLPTTVLTLVCVGAVGLVTYGLASSQKWFESRPQRIKRAIIKLLQQRHTALPDTVWIAVAIDLAHQAVPPHSPLWEAFTDIYDSEPDESKRAALEHLLITIADQIELQPTASRSSFLDEAAIFSADGDGWEEQVRSFEAKRALYHSFATSWPLRITLILLIFALGLVGWRTFELAELGQQAKKFSDEAVQQLDQAQRELDLSTTELTRTQGQLLTIVKDSNETLREARLAAADAKADLNKAVESGVHELNGATQNGIETLKHKLENKSDELHTELTRLTETKITALESHSSTQQHILDNHTFDLKTQLEAHRDNKITELNQLTNDIVQRLQQQEISATDRINAVFKRVESSEQARVESFNQALARNEQQIKQLQTSVAQLENTIQQHKPFATELVNVVNLIEKKGSWAQPGLLATLLEWRSGILALALLVAVMSLLLSLFALFRAKR